MGREDTVQLLMECLKDGHLVQHCLATGAMMKATALHLNEPPLTWEEIGIFHDIDYELVQGDMQRHGVEGERILLEHGIDPGTAAIVRRHNDYLQDNRVYSSRRDRTTICRQCIKAYHCLCAGQRRTAF